MRAFAGGVQNFQEITHERNSVDSKVAAENFVRTMQGLGDRLGSLLLQLRPLFAVEGKDVLGAFPPGLPKCPSYAVEVRHRSWIDSNLFDLLREHGAALTRVGYPRMPRLEEATAGFAYIRWLGNRRESTSGHTGPKKDQTEELRWWSRVADRFLQEGRTVFAYANNHYQHHSPSTVEQFLQIGREARGR